MSPTFFYFRRCPMFFRKLFGSVLLGFLGLTTLHTAHAQFAVIDVASLAQLIQEYQTLEQQVSTPKSQLSQAQSEYAAITGNRGMQNLLNGVQRNYLPTDAAQVLKAMGGSSGS